MRSTTLIVSGSYYSRLACISVTTCLALIWPMVVSAQVTEEGNSEVTVSGEDRAASAGVPDLTETARLIVREANKFRSQQDLGTLTPAEALDDAARYFARFMARSGKFGHQANGQRPTERARDQGYEPCIVAENLGSVHSAAETTPAELASQFIKNWKESEKHRTTMLDPDVTQVGVAVAHCEKTGYFFAVQMFGRPHSQAIEIRIANRTGTEIEYSLNDDVYWLPASLIRTHERCRPTEVDFYLSNDDATSQRRTFHVLREARFVVVRDAFGQLTVKRESPVRLGLNP